MSSVGSFALVAAAAGFLVVIVLVMRRLRHLTAAEIRSRMDTAGFPGWQRRLFLASVGWGAAGVAMAIGVILAVSSTWTESQLLETLAVAVLVVWVLCMVASLVASATGRPRGLLLAQFRDQEWSAMIRRRTDPE